MGDNFIYFWIYWFIVMRLEFDRRKEAFNLGSREDLGVRIEGVVSVCLVKSF